MNNEKTVLDIAWGMYNPLVYNISLLEPISSEWVEILLTEKSGVAPASALVTYQDFSKYAERESLFSMYMCWCFCQGGWGIEKIMSEHFSGQIRRQV